MYLNGLEFRGLECVRDWALVTTNSSPLPVHNQDSLAGLALCRLSANCPHTLMTRGWGMILHFFLRVKPRSERIPLVFDFQISLSVVQSGKKWGLLSELSATSLKSWSGYLVHSVNSTQSITITAVSNTSRTHPHSSRHTPSPPPNTYVFILLSQRKTMRTGMSDLGLK